MKVHQAPGAIECALLVLATALGAGSARAQYPYLVKDINPGTASSLQGGSTIADWNGRAALPAVTVAQGLEWWLSDGTEAGTQILLDIWPGPSSGVISSYAVEWNGFRYFQANDGVHGRELWRTDGTAAGTTLFFDFEPGAGSSSPLVTIAAGKLFVAATTLAYGREPWVSDGTAAGTQLLFDVNPGPASGFFMGGGGTSLFGKGLFAPDDGVHGREPWITDGTPAGTSMLMDMYPGPGSSINSSSIPLSIRGGVAIFGAFVGSVGQEPWATDGTTAGTYLVRDINPGSGSSISSFSPQAALSPGFLFMASTSASGEEPWITDGTAAGTYPLGDFYPGSTSSQPLAVDLGTGKAVFGANSPATGYEPWITDGTPAGTVLAEINPGPGFGSYYTNQLFYATGGRAYFPAFTPATSYELGTSDGTVSGTMLVKDLFAGTTDSFGGLFPVDGFLFYLQGVQGQPTRVAYSNGLPATTQLMPLDPAFPTGLMFQFRRIGDRIFFQSSHPSVGTELFALAVDGDGDGIVEYFDTLNFEQDCLCPPAVAPCGNADPAAGCANSTGVGARLDGSGTTVLAANDLVLTISQLPAFTKGLLLMGAKAASPVPFGDGVGCVGGSLARWPAHDSGPGGTTAYGPGLASRVGTSDSPLFRFTAGATRRFQFWYRDTAGPCGSGSNVSSSAAVVFTP
jgi:ELWxxDGT repeat protein